MATPTPKPAAPASASTAPAAAPAPAQSPTVMGADSEEEAVVVGPVVEYVNMSGLVLEKTVHPDGECETTVIRQPMIAEELVRETRAAQRQQGF